jgi:hypothetical protein
LSHEKSGSNPVKSFSEINNIAEIGKVTDLYFLSISAKMEVKLAKILLAKVISREVKRNLQGDV